MDSSRGQLSREEFAAACDAFLERGSSSSASADATAAIRGHVGWSLVVSPAVPTLRCISRTVPTSLIFRADAYADDAVDMDMEEDVGEVDEATVSQPVRPHAFYTVHQWIAYSPTYCVPVFYFACHDANGAPVPLDSIVATGFFHSQVTKAVKRTPHSLDLLDQDGEQAPFPLLSQGDHPVLGTPCWFLHPCETPVAMAELLRELTSPHSPVDWLDTWLALISTVLDLRT